MMSSTGPRVCVVGGGSSGIVCVKELVENGITNVRCFEAGPTVGGVFARRYELNELVSSNIITAFSDFMFDDLGPLDSLNDSNIQKNWKFEDFTRYLTLYKAKFGIEHLFEFNSLVQTIQRVTKPDGSMVFKVTIVRLSENQMQKQNAEDEKLPQTPTFSAAEVNDMIQRFKKYPTDSSLPAQAPGLKDIKDGVSVNVYEFDKVIVSSGIHGRPRFLDLPGQATFTGRITHHYFMKTGEFMKGKRVLVIGSGESAGDMCLLAARMGSQAGICIRGFHGYLVPRRVNGMCTDRDTSRVRHIMPPTVFGSFPQLLRHYGQTWWGRLIFGKAHANVADDPEINAYAEWSNWEQWKRGMYTTTNYGTKNLGFCEAIVKHGAKRFGDIKEIRGDKIIFVDGQEFQCDIILESTGWNTRFPFLEQHHLDLAQRAYANPPPLWRRMYDLEFRENLVFCGFVRPGYGGIPPMTEMQARLHALVLSGKKKLPSKEAMMKQIDIDEARWKRQYGSVLDTRNIVDFCVYLHMMAKEIGCNPPYLKLLCTDPYIAYKCVVSPITPASWRLAGPNAKPDYAKQIMRKVPVSPRQWLWVAYIWCLSVAYFFTRIQALKPNVIFDSDL